MTRRRTRAAALLAILQRRYRTYKKYTDPITLEPVQFPVFVHVSAQGKQTVFSARILAAYCLTSGDIKHPLTRVPFSSVEIRRLARISNQSL